MNKLFCPKEPLREFCYRPLTKEGQESINSDVQLLWFRAKVCKLYGSVRGRYHTSIVTRVHFILNVRAEVRYRLTYRRLRQCHQSNENKDVSKHCGFYESCTCTITTITTITTIITIMKTNNESNNNNTMLP